jgi:hypothetical protein
VAVVQAVVVWRTCYYDYSACWTDKATEMHAVATTEGLAGVDDGKIDVGSYIEAQSLDKHALTKVQGPGCALGAKC